MIDKEKEIKLNLGSGARHIKGFISIDSTITNFLPNPDKIETKVVIISKDKPLPFKDNSVSKIFTSHFIEHFPYYDTVKLLSQWRRVLKKGGTIDIWTVDFEVIRKNEKMEWVNWRLYAGRYKYPGAWHKAIFDFNHLKTKLIKAGFKKVRRIPKNSFPFNRMGLHKDMNMGVRATK